MGIGSLDRKNMIFEFKRTDAGIKERLLFDNFSFVERLKVCKKLLFKKKITVLYDLNFLNSVREHLFDEAN